MMKESKLLKTQMKTYLSQLPAEVQQRAAVCLQEENLYKKGLFILELAEMTKKSGLSELTLTNISGHFGMSMTSLKRVRVISEQGNADQKQRAIDGCGISTIAHEIIPIVIPTNLPTSKICKVCRKEHPISEFKASDGYYRNICRACSNSVNSRNRGSFGVSTDKEISKDLMAVPHEEIENALYNKEAVMYTSDDLIEELTCISNNYSKSFINCLNEHQDMLTDANRQKVSKVIKKVSEDIKQVLEG